MNFNDFQKTVIKNLNVNFDWANPEQSEVTIHEDGHTQKGKTVRKALASYIGEENTKKINDHFGKNFVDNKEFPVPPVYVYFMAFGKLPVADFMEHVLKAPKDAEIIATFIPEDKFVGVLFDCYKQQAAIMKKATAPVVEGGIKLPSLSDTEEVTLNTILKGFKIPEWGTLTDALGSVSETVNAKVLAEKALQEFTKASEAETKRLTKLLGELQLKAEVAVAVEVKGDGTIPAGKVVQKRVCDLFPGTKLEFEVPCWEWEGVHPLVPNADPFYIFREDLLVSALYAIQTNQRAYLQGHTGSGKTTLIEQIAARLNWPFMRVNFDSEITRMDLIGRDTLKEGASVFVDGILPQMMQGPHIAVFDEIDFCRPDVAYVMQSALEGNSFKITEDGGREVKPHPMFRMFATGNTVGQGDEHGMYQGARAQSLAFLDRFQVWIKVPYLTKDERLELISRSYPSLSKETAELINKYATEHLAAFEQANVLQPISPRGILALARSTAMLTSMYGNQQKALKEAMQMVILNRCTNSDHVVLKGVVDRVLK